MSVHSVSTEEGDIEKTGSWRREQAAATNDKGSWTPSDRAEDFESRMRVVRRIAVVTSLSYKLVWFLGFCALTWGSAVLLGAYITDVSIGDFYGVSVLLFVEGVRFGMAGFVRKMRYKMAPMVRSLVLEGVQGLLAVSIFSTALYSLLPDTTQALVRRHIFHHYSPATPDAGLRRALHIFYWLMLVNAGLVLVGGVTTGVLRWWKVSPKKSLHDYHDKLVGSSLTEGEVSDWLLGGYFCLQFAFKVLSDEYRSGGGAGAGASGEGAAAPIFICSCAGATDSEGAGKQKRESKAEVMCREYGDLICYMYLDKQGFHAAEVALEAEDVYVREAAANVVWYWAVLEDVVIEASAKDRRPPLCLQRGLLCKLGNLVTGNYGPASSAAASAFKVLLQSPNNPVETVVSVEVVDMLVQYVKGLALGRKHPLWEEGSHAPVRLLSCLLRQLQSQTGSATTRLIERIYGGLELVHPPLPELPEPHQQLRAVLDYVSRNFPSALPSSSSPDADLKKAFQEGSKDPRPMPSKRLILVRLAILVAVAGLVLIFNVGVFHL